MKHDLWSSTDQITAALPLVLLPEPAHRGGHAVPLRKGAPSRPDVDQGGTR